MNKFAIAVHGGAGPDSPFIRKNKVEIEAGLASALDEGYRVMEHNGSALDAVEAAVRNLEDNPFFNAGRGSSLNSDGKVQMDASIMNGEDLNAGACASLRKVKNPVTFARKVMEYTSHVLIGGDEAMELAEYFNLRIEPDSYFITDYRKEEYKKEIKKKPSLQKLLIQKISGTVGAVACDQFGNIAAATSSGGTAGCLPGRIGDSCIIGSGCYADNSTCAVSGTGEGEYLMRFTIARSVAAEVEYSEKTLQECCDYIIHEKNKDVHEDLGIIVVNSQGDIGISFNSERMMRGWKRSGEKVVIGVYE